MLTSEVLNNLSSDDTLIVKLGEIFAERMVTGFFIFDGVGCEGIACRITVEGFERCHGDTRVIRGVVRYSSETVSTSRDSPSRIRSPITVQLLSSSSSSRNDLLHRPVSE